MKSWKLRGCPRCAGDVYIEKDYDSTYERCLQCGYVKEVATSVSTSYRVVKEAQKVTVHAGIS